LRCRVRGGKANMDGEKEEEVVLVMAVGKEEAEEEAEENLLQELVKGGMEKKNVLVRGLGAGGEGLATV